MTVNTSLNKSIILRNLATFFMLANLLYNLFPFPPIFWRLGFIILCMFTLLMRNRDIRFLEIEKWVLSFVLMNIVYYFVSYLWQTPYSTQLGNTLYSMLSLSFFYYLTRKHTISISFIDTFLIAFTLSGIYAYIHARQLLLLALALGEDTDLTNNASTLFLCLLPLIFLAKKKWIKFLALSICLYFIIISAKRGNIVASIFPLIFIIPNFIRQSRTPWMKVVIFCILSFIIYNAYTVFVENDYVMQRMEQMQEGNSSHRDEIYSAAWNLWSQSMDLGHILLGYGTDGTVNNLVMHKRAHNDWLEILVDYGILGIILYLGIFYSLFKVIRKSWKYVSYRYALLSIAFIWLCKSAYSMGFQEEWFAFLLMPLGIILGRIENDKMQLSK